MNGFYLERKDAAKNMNRFYKVIVTETLFGEWALIREWGRIGSPGTVREEWFDTADRAGQAASRARGQKQRRGYITVG
ncbi:WGR domain-containing protein [Methylocaldum sp. BRCS4]|nr:WGR domain-containing protein [Methylocaldum sp. BRCS4]